jgi:hypothetical protein
MVRGEASVPALRLAVDPNDAAAVQQVASRPLHLAPLVTSVRARRAAPPFGLKDGALEAI